jgi:hypothetical protein
MHPHDRWGWTRDAGRLGMGERQLRGHAEMAAHQKGAGVGVRPGVALRVRPCL